MKIHYLLVLLCCNLCCLYLAAQEQKHTGIVRGQIADAKDGLSIPYATIKFGLMPDYITAVKVLATDENGKFETVLPLGKYSVTISCLGYKSVMKFVDITATGNPADMGLVSLAEDEIQLKEVIVKPLVEITATEIVYNLDQDPDREHSSMHQILEKVPMIGRTPDNKIYVGDPQSSFLVVRNGKEDALFAEKKNLDEILKSLPAKAFASVKVQLVPESRYGAYKYILNIETDKTNRLFGVINLNKEEYEAPKGVIKAESGILSSYDKLRFSFGAGYTGSHSPRNRQYTERYYLTDDFSQIQEGKTYKTGNSYVTGGTFSYDLAKQHFLTGRISYNPSRQTDWKNLSNRQVKQDMKTEYYTESSYLDIKRDLSGMLNYQYDFAKPKRILNIVYDFVYSPGKQSSNIDAAGDYNLQDIPPILAGNTKNNQQVIQIHYSDPISSKIRLEAGISYIFRNYRSRSEYRDISGNIIPEQGAELESSKHILGNYVSLRYDSKKIGINLKFRTEYLDDGKGAKSIQGIGPPEFIRETRFSFIPQGTVSMAFSNKPVRNISLTYRWDKWRPSINMMTSVRNYTTPGYIFVGNPALKPEDTHHITLSLNTKKQLNFNILGSYSDNKISQYWYKDPEGAIVQSYANYGSYWSTGFSVSYSLLWKKVSFMAMGSEDYSYNKIAEGLSTKSLRGIISLSMSRPVYKTVSLNLGANYFHNYFSGMQKMDFDPLNISFSTKLKLFKERLEVETGLSNIVRFRNRIEREVNTPEFTLYQVNKTNNPPFFIKLNWRIGSFNVKPVKKAYKDIQIDDVIKE